MVRLRKGKHKTWRKGQSCESNPATRKYRTAAKRGSITGRSTQNSNLTVEALAKHEERHDDDGDVELKEDEGFSVKSGQTFGAFSISGLTDCSNPVFATVKRFWDSPSSQHKEVSCIIYIKHLLSQIMPLVTVIKCYRIYTLLTERNSTVS